MSDSPNDDDFTVDSYSKADILYHAAGLVLNTFCLLAAAAWLFSLWRSSPPAWYLLLLATAAGVFVGDLITGLFHWAFDTWFSENTSLLSRMVIMVREHHVYPNRLFLYRFRDHAGALSWVALFLTAPVFLVAVFAPQAPAAAGGYAVWAGILVSFQIVFMFEFHKLGHRPHRSRIVRRMQKAGLLLSTKHHMTHHSGKHDRNYCLINGVADNLCGNPFLWRGLEAVISSLTGAVPQSNDLEWLRRHRS
jgi:Lipid desaturase domain